jgi:hypothetical protein
MSCRQAVLLIGVGMIAGLAGCGLQNINPVIPSAVPSKPATVLFVITPPSSLAINATTALSAAVINYSANANSMVGQLRQRGRLWLF